MSEPYDWATSDTPDFSITLDVGCNRQRTQPKFFSQPTPIDRATGPTFDGCSPRLPQRLGVSAFPSNARPTRLPSQGCRQYQP
jgi:hypothetical protein